MTPQIQGRVVIVQQQATTSCLLKGVGVCVCCVRCVYACDACVYVHMCEHVSVHMHGNSVHMFISAYVCVVCVCV
eukprot:m.334125 g.334125  ORF g.334125 m.334125 type:complete len:75 (-) comp16068_c0_seq8:3279-3503(-)